MLWLSGVECAATRDLCPRVGLMLNPDAGTDKALRRLPYLYGADNGCFAKGDDFDEFSWMRYLAGLRNAEVHDRCLFAVAPDVVGDPDGTWARSETWLAFIRSLDMPAALVAQDGAEDHVPMWDEEDAWDCLFIGGSTEWKLSSEALDCCDEAMRRGKWVHVGRVNSEKRLVHFLGRAHSSDGTFLGFGPEKNRPAVERWLRVLDTPEMFPRWKPLADAEVRGAGAALSDLVAQGWPTMAWHLAWKAYPSLITAREEVPA